MTRRDQGAAIWAGVALVLAGVLLGWAISGHGASGSTSTSPAAPSTSGRMTTDPEQIVVQVVMPTSTPEPTPTATAKPVLTSTPTRGYPYCEAGMPAGTLCYDTVAPQPTETPRTCDGSRNGLCRAPSWEPSSGRTETE